MKNFKSYGFWTALAGGVVMLLNSLGKCFGFAVEEEIVTDVIMAVAGLLVVFGIVSMPKKDKTTDDILQTKTEEDAEGEKEILQEEEEKEIDKTQNQPNKK